MLNLKALLTKILQSLTVNELTFTDNYSGEYSLKKQGKVVSLYYTAYWSGFSANTSYALGTLPEGARPSTGFYAPATIARNDGILNGPAQVTIETNGNVTAKTGPSYTYTSGWIEVAVCFIAA